ncbi:vitamin D3 hydroxylase-associated protein-like [Protopterus annectens]|uniref:vitamin D3 hydroxylase-associated protein-like n=1 Tax=Protopterus annectens TaxID=7888 RepID=UPI001CFB1674|nr:vitamin D3 hydroxylase-associated protein-like [Protopterus annectens]
MIADNLTQTAPEAEFTTYLLGTILACSVVTIALIQWARKKKIAQKIETARAKRENKVKEMKKAVAQFKQQKPEEDGESIVALSLSELTEKLKNGSLSPDSVLYAYMEKAVEVHEELNCLTDFFHECQTELQELKKTEKKGLLYGIPVSLKECIDYKGHSSTTGILKRLDQPLLEDSVIVQVLKKCGAIPFVATNVSQTLICYDCSNPIYGETLNPLNHKKGPGGSSGGGGALIGGGGSILGFGTDTAGSIRIPAGFCGICSLKPTGNRLSTHGFSECLEGMKSFVSVTGPMARDVDSLALCMKALLCEDMFHLDPAVPPLPFNNEIYTSSSPLRIGYYESDGFLMPTPSAKRAVAETSQLLQKAGHTLIPFSPPKMEYVFYELFLRGIMADAGTTLLDHLKGDIVDPNLEPSIRIHRLPVWLKKIFAFVLKPLAPRFAKMYSAACGTGSVKNLWRLHADAQHYCREYIAEWMRLKLDVLLCPALCPAFTIGYPGQFLGRQLYTFKSP